MNIPFHDIASVQDKGNAFDDGAPFDNGARVADGIEFNDDTAIYVKVNTIDNGTLYDDAPPLTMAPSAPPLMSFSVCMSMTSTMAPFLK